MKKFKRHFRFHKVQGHPVYILAENDKYYTYIKLTHSHHTFGQRNIPLSRGCEEGDQKINYIIPMVCVDDKSHFGPIKDNFKFNKCDGAIIRDLLKTIRELKK